MMQALEPTQDPSWVLTHEGYNVLTENAVESRFALGNGFLGMRASRPVSRGPTWVSWLGYIRWASWPRCYVAGLFDRPNTVPPVPALVPVADWSRVRLVLDDNPQLLLDGEFLASVRQLDLRRGMLLSDLSYRAHAGITITGGELRLVSLADRAVALQLLRFSLDRDGIDVALEANFAMAGMGMEPLQLDRDVSAWRTEGSGKAVAMAGSATLRAGGRPLVPERAFSLRWIWRWRSVAGQVLELDRLVTVARSDRLADDPAPVATDALSRSRALGWRGVLAAHETAWQQHWHASDVIIEGDDEVQEAVRFAVYHLTSAANPEDEGVSVGARGLTGDAYFGHVFWDTEIYLLPFYVTVWPEAARALLMYRYHTLSGARAKADAMGYKGALYAWESADTGEETTPEQVVGPGGEAIDILTGRMEQHISADIAYAVWQYWRATGDDRFLIDAGAEILLETARFWASRAVSEADGQRHIRHVIGPDEYHEDVDDNAFTNVMARWNITRGLEAIEVMRTRWPDRAELLWERLALSEPELADWRDAVGRIVTGLDPATGLYEQFGGYYKLEPLDLSLYADRKMPIDVVIGRERTQRSQVVKQADVVALLALLPDEFPGAAAKANFRYYEPRCAHGSSLSAGIHALVAARLGETETALRFLRQAAAADLELDPNSAGGIRIAGLGGLWQAIVFGFAGLDLKGDTLGLDPKLPPQCEACHSACAGGAVPWQSASLAIPCRRRWSRAKGWSCGSERPRRNWQRARHSTCRCKLPPCCRGVVMTLKNAFYAQSGGVSAVINASACGVVQTARQHPEEMGQVYAGRNGIIGALTEDLIDTSFESEAAIAALKHTPGAAFGSCRYKLGSIREHRAQYERLIEVFRAHDIGFFFYNGGGDSQDTAYKVSQLGAELGYPIVCVGIPKTMDNDLPITDCSPGFGSVAKYVATSLREAALDLAAMSRTSTKVFTLEVMGRHAGWTTAACALAAEHEGDAPHILLLPEVAFNQERFLAKVEEALERYDQCVIAVSEGVKGADGEFLSASGLKDSFGHAQLGGVAPVITHLISTKLGCKCHWAVPDYLLRSARHIASETDLQQAYAVGRAAVEFAIGGRNAVMPAIRRLSDSPYRWDIIAAPLAEVANQEKLLPPDFISADGFGITEAARRYLAPLIVGEAYPPFKHGLPDYIKLRNAAAPKKLTTEFAV